MPVKAIPTAAYKLHDECIFITGTKPMTLTTYGTKVDMREIAPRDRHPLIFSTFRSLGVGESMELINDHDPKPLYDRFRAELPNQFTWHDVQSGPEVWRVRIAKPSKPHGNGQCCGSCGGA